MFAHIQKTEVIVLFRNHVGRYGAVVKPDLGEPPGIGAARSNDLVPAVEDLDLHLFQRIQGMQGIGPQYHVIAEAPCDQTDIGGQEPAAVALTAFPDLVVLTHGNAIKTVNVFTRQLRQIDMADNLPILHRVAADNVLYLIPFLMNGFGDVGYVIFIDTVIDKITDITGEDSINRNGERVRIGREHGDLGEVLARQDAAVECKLKFLADIRCIRCQRDGIRCKRAIGRQQTFGDRELVLAAGNEFGRHLIFEVPGRTGGMHGDFVRQFVAGVFVVRGDMNDLKEPAQGLGFNRGAERHDGLVGAILPFPFHPVDAYVLGFFLQEEAGIVRCQLQVAGNRFQSGRDHVLDPAVVGGAFYPVADNGEFLHDLRGSTFARLQLVDQRHIDEFAVVGRFFIPYTEVPAQVFCIDRGGQFHVQIKPLFEDILLIELETRLAAADLQCLGMEAKL